VNILLEGSVDDILMWSDQQTTTHVSCRTLLRGKSPRVAEAYTQVALDIIHRALKESRAERHGEPETPYVVLTLHRAAESAPASGWVAFDDDARHVVALEVAQRLRVVSATYFGKQAPLLDAPAHEPAQRPAWSPDSTRVLSFVSRLVDADLAAEQGGRELVAHLERLRTGFGLDQVELAKLLRVAPQAIRKWQRGGGATPENRAAIDVHLDELRRLESYFAPGRLPSILRRKDRGLNGRRPVELVIAGKADHFADYVERVIADDRTA